MVTQTIRKLRVFSKGVMVSELPLDKAALSIGRDPQGDLRLRGSKISRHHAKLTQVASNYFIEDCNSTNGTLLNGKPLQKHIFRPGDNLRIGNFELRYVIEGDADQPADVMHAVVRPISKGKGVKLQKGALSFLQGPKAGQVKTLKEALFTVGSAGESIAVIARRAQGIYLLHIGGQMPTVNGAEITNSVQLQDSDVIEVGEHQIKLTLN